MRDLYNPDIFLEDFDEDNLEHFAVASLLPMVLSPDGNVEEDIHEVISCDSISGGQRYENEMPKELSLVRKLLNGTEYRARYVQVQE